MNNDLISRSALKKAIKSYADDQYAENEYLGECAIMDIIDNAPTVEVRGLPKIHYDRGFIAGYEKGKAERPHGEWKVYGTQGGIPITDYCSNCKYEMMWYKNKYNFCPNCGAYMTNRSMEGLGLLHKGGEE